MHSHIHTCAHVCALTFSCRCPGSFCSNFCWPLPLVCCLQHPERHAACIRWTFKAPVALCVYWYVFVRVHVSVHMRAMCCVYDLVSCGSFCLLHFCYKVLATPHYLLFKQALICNCHEHFKRAHTHTHTHTWMFLGFNVSRLNVAPTARMHIHADTHVHANTHRHTHTHLYLQASALPLCLTAALTASAWWRPASRRPQFQSLTLQSWK